MEKYVIYETAFHYCVTTLGNYEASIQNERCICKFDKNKFTPETVESTLKEWGIAPENIINKIKGE